MFKTKINNFLELTRAYSLLTSIAPWFVAVACSAVSPHIYSSLPHKLINVLLTFIGIILVHLGGNLLDDYIDIKRKLKNNKLQNIDFKHAKDKARLILNETYSLKQVEAIIVVLFGTASAIGIYFTVLYGWIIPLYMIITGILCLLYPISSKCGFSELIIWAIFGPLLISGTFTALTGFFSIRILILSMSIGLMSAVLLDSHSLMDYEYDKDTGKNTLCVLCKSKTRALILIAGEILLSYIIIIALALSKMFSHYLLLSVIITAPLAGKLLCSLRDYIYIKDVKFIPKWHFGPMENWDKIKEKKYEYFMYRFFIARNLGFIFSLIIAIVCFFTLDIQRIYV